MVTYVIDYTPKTVKAQLSPLSNFYGGLEEFEVKGGGGGVNEWGAKKGYFFISIIREKLGKFRDFDR